MLGELFFYILFKVKVQSKSVVKEVKPSMEKHSKSHAGKAWYNVKKKHGETMVKCKITMFTIVSFYKGQTRVLKSYLSLKYVIEMYIPHTS